MRLHGQRMIQAPGAWGPPRLRYEDVRHERLEHGPTPARHDSHATVGVRALEHVNTEVVAGGADRLLLLPRPVAARREGPPLREVVDGRQLATGDADVGGDTGLRDSRVVPEAGVEDVRTNAQIVALDGVCWRRRLLRPEPAAQQTARRLSGGVGIVVGLEVHRLEQLLCELRHPWITGVAHHDERRRQPARTTLSN